MRYFIELSYHGAPYHGWQRQPNASTVQQTLEEGLSTLLRSTIPVTGAGRTDTGVHARQMFAHFDCDTSFDPEEIERKLNSLLPAGIAIHAIRKVHEDAHARFDATSRTYKYLVIPRKDPFTQGLAYYHRYPLSTEMMNHAAEVLLGRQDFRCFSRSNTDVKTFFCAIEKATWNREDNGLLVFTITADRFLRNMVRAVVGTLLEVGRGKITPENVKKIIESKNRGNAGASVPAHGLYLTKITYPFI
ncbi:tRNA pseudouridine(38-40) synthase TruA [Sinomicrobium soli]|uniref:tRNA pseudouridine(38-40) synthase TruA n=1 Tax=Sinomicrobium sp. N-1-3-6 TaxID=2219864 RepID=UPI000DCBACDD|nr:tRNA pseudouridine(38-40) synthase TruA [Sinomicrobium sp. N-1-3-6]RAV29921.1 tRNA pseudouridine(38-40) synthase TruA [Sinomicrobium sp. N-1-3-6]